MTLSRKVDCERYRRTQRERDRQGGGRGEGERRKERGDKYIVAMLVDFNASLKV